MSEEDCLQHRHCLSSRSCCKAKKWKEGKATYTFEQSDRSWIRHKRNLGVEVTRSNPDSPNAETSVLIIGLKNSHSEVNKKLGEVSRDNSRGQILEGQPLSTPSRMMFIKLSRIWPKHPGNETKLTSARELPETSKSLGDHARGSRRNTWKSSKSVTMRDEHRTARKSMPQEK